MRNACISLSRAVVLLAVCAVCYAQSPSGFDSQQGFIPTIEGPCHATVDLPDPLEDGQIIDLGPVSDDFCRGISRWRISEYTRGKFVAAPRIPLPDPLIVKCRRIPNHTKETCGLLVNYREDTQCTPVGLEAAPIEDAHEVLKTEECSRTLYFGYAEEVVFRGIFTGTVRSHEVAHEQVSEFKRWLVTVDAPESILGYELMAVEEFEPYHGNARWHLAQWDRFYQGAPDVTAGGCPPGDWRDILPLEREAFDTHSMKEAHRSASHLDYLGRPPRMDGGMRVIPTNGAMRSSSTGRHNIMDYATGDQIHRVVQTRENQCVATARMVMPKDSADEHVKALLRRMAEDDKIWVNYTPVWRREHIWYRRMEVNGRIPDEPNYVFRESSGIAHREPEQSTDTVTVPSKCPVCPVCPEPPKRTRTPTRSR